MVRIDIFFLFNLRTVISSSFFAFLSFFLSVSLCLPPKELKGYITNAEKEAGLGAIMLP